MKFIYKWVSIGISVFWGYKGINRYGGSFTYGFKWETSGEYRAIYRYDQSLFMHLTGICESFQYLHVVINRWKYCVVDDY